MWRLITSLILLLQLANSSELSLLEIIKTSAVKVMIIDCKTAPKKFGITKNNTRIKALIDFNIQIPKGSIYGLLGPNGAGKSVTFNVVLGIMRADTGDIFANGLKINTLPIHERSKKFKIGYIPQSDSIFRGLSCEDNLAAIGEIVIKDGIVTFIIL